MIQSGTENLQDKVIFVLAQKGRLSTLDIRRELTKQNTPATLQGIYRVLRVLNNTGVILKEKQVYSLRISWILGLTSFVSQMQNHYLQSDYLDQLLPRQKEQKIVWYFNDLSKTHDFWSQIMLAMAHQSKKHVYLNSATYLWRELIHKKQEKQFKMALYEKIRGSYTIVSNKTYLDKLSHPCCSNEHEKQHIYFAANSSEAIEKDATTYIDIIDDYVLTTVFPKNITNALEALYSRISPAIHLTKQDIETLLALRGKVKMIIKRAPDIAERYHKRFERIFGPIR